jgi:hypothetical protein
MNSAVENARNIPIVEFYVSRTERAFQQPLPSVYLYEKKSNTVGKQHASAPCELFVQYVMSKENRRGLKSLTLFLAQDQKALKQLKSNVQ